jgi:hypothetical protein
MGLGQEEVKRGISEVSNLRTEKTVLLDFMEWGSEFSGLHFLP